MVEQEVGIQSESTSQANRLLEKEVYVRAAWSEYHRTLAQRKSETNVNV